MTESEDRSTSQTNLAKSRTNLSEMRTNFSNERTLLSYLRTSIQLFILSVALFKFFFKPVVLGIAGGVMVLAVIFFAIGLYRFSKRRRQIRATFREQNDSVQ